MTATNASLFLFACALSSAIGQGCNSHPNIDLIGSPSAPVLVGTTAGAESVSLTWQANPIAEKVISYEVKAASTPFTVWSASLPDALDRSDVPCCSLRIGGLRNGTRYWLVVQAVNAAGDGAASAEMSALPPGWRGPILIPNGDGVYAMDVDSADDVTVAVFPEGTVDRFDGSGAPVWSVTFPSQDAFAIDAIASIGTSGAFVGGIYRPPGSAQPYVVRIDGGAVAWQDPVVPAAGCVPPNGLTDGLAFDPGGAVYATGWVCTSPSNVDRSFLARFDASSGSNVWTRTFAPIGDQTNRVALAGGREFFAAQSTSGAGVLVSYDAAGDPPTSTKIYDPGCGGVPIPALGPVADNAGRLFLADICNGSALMVDKLEQNGAADWGIYDLQPDFQATAIAATPDGDLVIVGSAPGAFGSALLVLLRLDGTSGAPLFERQIFLGSGGSVLSVAVDREGYIYVGGGATELDGVPNAYGAFVMKFDPSGNPI